MSQIRIGDAERDSAAAALGEHYAAGRLTKDEYDERIDRVWAAKYEDDLVPLFIDLPRRHTLAARGGAVTTASSGQTKPAFPPGPAARFRPLTMLVPIVAAGLIAAVIFGGASWLWLLLLFWFAGGMGHRRHRHWAHSR